MHFLGFVVNTKFNDDLSSIDSFLEVARYYSIDETASQGE